jgi:hypothetical protein
MKEIQNTKNHLSRTKTYKLILKYLLDIDDVCIHFCYSCSNLFFLITILFTTYTICIEKWQKKFKDIILNNEFFENYIPNREKTEKIVLCRTCYNYFNKGKIPPLNISNGFSFIDIPEVLKKLTYLEQRFVSPRLVFQIIFELARQKQKATRGNLVNIPIDIFDDMLKFLPRQLNNIEVLDVKFQRRLNETNSFFHETIRPHCIINALEFLLKQPLYIKHNIKMNLNWLDNHLKDTCIIDTDNCCEKLTNTNELINSDSENEDEQRETLLMDLNNRGLVLAPGENKIPKGLPFDEDAEELSFPGIFCGNKRNIYNRTKRLDNKKNFEKFFLIVNQKIHFFEPQI